METSEDGRAARLDGGTVAVLFATHVDAEGLPTAAQPFRDEVPQERTVLTRLSGQLRGLGVRRIVVVVRPGGEQAVAGCADGLSVVTSPDLAGDLAALARAAEQPGPLVIGAADVVTHREALAGLLADPRIASGILTTSARVRSAVTFPVRALRGRLVSAGSPFHRVDRPTGLFLEVLKVDRKDLPALRGVLTELGRLAEDPPTSWLAEYDRKVLGWQTKAVRAGLQTAAAKMPARGIPEDPDRWKPVRLGAPVTPSGVQQQIEDLLADRRARIEEKAFAALNARIGMSRTDTVSLVLTGLVRSGVQLSNSYLRQLYWARPTGEYSVNRARQALAKVDEDAVLLSSAVKANDGFFTTHFVSPYSRYIARWAAHRGLTPNQVTTMSMLVGVLAAASFAVGSRAGLVGGALLLQLAFTLDCVDGQLARYSRQFSKLGAWLDSVFDRAKEYVVYAGLAFGAARNGESLWVLASVALAVQTVRHLMDFSYAANQHEAIESLTQVPLDVASDRPDAAGAEPVPAIVTTASVAPEVTEDLEEEPSEPSPEEVVAVSPATVSPRQRARVLGRRLIRFWHRLDRLPGLLWTKRIILLPIGERFALISVAAAFVSARFTFAAILTWGAFALTYGLFGRSVRSVAR